MKRLLAYITIASLTLGSATFVYAEDAAPNENEAVDTVEGGEAGAEGEVAPEEVAVPEVGQAPEEVAAPVVDPVPLKYTEKDFYTPDGSYKLGKYPEITDNKDLTEKIYNLLMATYREELENNERINFEQELREYYSYTVEELPTAAKVVLNILVPHVTSGEYNTKEFGVLYIDTTTSNEMTEEAYTALIPVEAPEEEAAPEEVVEVPEVLEVPAEPIMVPIRAHAEALGYEVLWNEEGSVDVVSGENTTTIVLDQNAYVTFAGEIVELDEAPVFLDGTVYVTVQFFSEILGATVVIAEDGTVYITAGPAVAAPAGEEAEGEAPAEGEETPEVEGETVDNSDAPADETEGTDAE